MLELLRVLSHSQEKLLHDIIFLFNGAEESVLQVQLHFIGFCDTIQDIVAKEELLRMINL